MKSYLPRLADPVLTRLHAELPALLIVGPRACGKTTTAIRLARTVVRLDREAEAVAFRADPDSALRGLEEPVLLDEWQAVPGVLGAVKRAVDADPRPGRFLLTGSVHADLEQETWPGTGRVVRLTLHGMTVRERLGRTECRSPLDRIADGEPPVPEELPDLREYIEHALVSGFPEPALSLTSYARQVWLDSYAEQLVTRDAPGVEPRRDPVRLRRFLEAYALNTAGVVSEQSLLDASGTTRRTAASYEQLLVNLFVVESVPAWATNRLKRLVRQGKRYVLDAALAAAVLRVDSDAIVRDGALLGRLLDTFVAAQLRAELQVSGLRPRLYHVRQEQGRHEIDLLADLGPNGLVGIEVKATASPSAHDARHLAWLRDQLGDGFRHGVLLHTGPATFELGPRLTAAPISSLWSGAR